MTRKPSPVRDSNPKSAVAQIDKILLNVKRMASDLALLREEVRTLDPGSASDREYSAISQRLYLLRQQDWMTGDLIRDFEEAFDAAKELHRAPAQLRLTGGRG
jgi:hypothetical protein